MRPQGKLEETGRATAKRGFCRVNKAYEALAPIPFAIPCFECYRAIAVWGRSSKQGLTEEEREKIYGRVG